MKHIKYIFVLILIISSPHTFAQLSAKEMRNQKKELKAKEIAQLIANKQFVFKANSLTTSNGFYKSLISNYDLKVKSDSIIAFLPYWGRVYMARLTDEGGIEFKEKAKKFEIKDKGKKGYHLHFSINHEGDDYNFTLTVSKSGYADLRVSTTRKSMISYYGTIEPIKNGK